MNRQEVLNTVLPALWKQGGRSVAHGACRYRGADGRRCAVGWLIPDESYTPSMEGKSVTQIRHRLEAMGILDNEEDRFFLSDLQRAHDDAHDEVWDSPEDFLDYFRVKLYSYLGGGLTLPSLT